jgi:succinoglycan biosynthesis transport protein ExoP
VRFVRRYALWIVLATVACTIGGWVITARQPAQFTAAATVDVEANVIPGAAPVPPNLATEQQVATSGSVLSSAASTVGLSSSQLHLSVTNKAGTNILVIACSAGTATGAMSCANTVAAAYREYRNEDTSPAAVQARDPLHVTIVTAAPLPGAKSNKRKVELLVVSVVLGLALGIGTAFLRDRLDDRIRDRDDLGRYLQAPVLGEVPALRGRSVRAETGVIQAPQSALAEAYRHLRARISPLIASTDSQGKVLLVTSPQAGEGRTSVAVNLAAVIALTGANVLLVDADLRNRTLGRLFQAADRPGLTDLLAGRARIGDVIKSTDFAPGLSLMTAGTVAIRPGDLLDAARLGRAFSQLTVLADVVIVDTGPVRAISDPLALVPVSDIVIMVADVRRTRRAAVTAAVQDITGIRPVTVVGVLNRVPQPWRRDEAPVPGTRTQPAPATIIQAARDGEPVTVANDRLPVFGPVESPRDHAGDAETPGISANGGPSSGGTSPDGSGPDGVQTAAWPLPSG